MHQSHTFAKARRSASFWALALSLLFGGGLAACAENGARGPLSKQPTVCGSEDEPEVMICNDLCVDTKKDPHHCGGCAGEGGQVCPLGTACEQGSCVVSCTSPLEQECDGSCSNYENDNLHCGGCPGVECDLAAGERCASGVCQIPNNQSGNNNVVPPVVESDNDCPFEVDCLLQACAVKPECQGPTLGDGCPFPTECIPACVERGESYTMACDRARKESTLGSGSGGGSGGGSTGSSVAPDVNELLSAAGAFITDPEGALAGLLGASQSTPLVLPDYDENLCQPTLGDGACGSSCTKLMAGGVMAVDPHVAIVGSLDNSTDTSDCFMFEGQDSSDPSLIGFVAPGLVREKLSVYFDHIPDGHDYDIQIFWQKAGDSETDACSSPVASTDAAVPDEKELQWTPGRTVRGDGTFYVVITRKAGAEPKCGGQYRLIINGIR